MNEYTEFCYVCQNFHTRPYCRPGLEYVSSFRQLVKDWYWYIKSQGWK